jgi:hypothetical protein
MIRAIQASNQVQSNLLQAVLNYYADPGLDVRMLLEQGLEVPTTHFGQFSINHRPHAGTPQPVTCSAGTCLMRDFRAHCARAWRLGVREPQHTLQAVQGERSTLTPAHLPEAERQIKALHL